MQQTSSLKIPKTAHHSPKTDALLKLLATGESEIKNGHFRSAAIVFQELDSALEDPSFESYRTGDEY